MFLGARRGPPRAYTRAGQHQFGKVELVKVTAPADAQAEIDALVADAERCLQLLELPYRALRLCAGDIGFSARQCVDLEVWLPGQQAYRGRRGRPLGGSGPAARAEV